ncbi:MAG: hypothetical protein OK449_02425 [Thaumarchaeota archaeon]|nr:hypothetical protein [Nitrososphaerota archaeon]
MSKKQPRPAPDGAQTGERYCVLCEEEDGKYGEPADYMVTITPANGGEERRVAACAAHVKSLSKPDSPYRIVAAPTKSRRAKSAVKPVEHNKGKSEKADVKRTLRGVERYSKTERGKLGE